MARPVRECKSSKKCLKHFFDTQKRPRPKTETPVTELPKGSADEELRGVDIAIAVKSDADAHLRPGGRENIGPMPR